ncbi:MAG: type II secretion system protein [Oscillospiraceae bacterium]
MKRFKGFTLVELIIVMAILTILMAAIMNMMKPIRSTYIDSTLYESQRNTQTGMSQYLAESTRYAAAFGIYSKGESASYTFGTSTVNRSVTDVASAAKYFLDDASGLTAANLISDPSKKAAAITAANTLRSDLEQHLQIITINEVDNKFTYNNKAYYGRLLRRKGTAAVTSNAEVPGTSECRIALGEAYYGESDYSIKVNFDATAGSRSVTYTVSSVPHSALMPDTVVSTESFVPLANLDIDTSFCEMRAAKLGITSDNISLMSIGTPYVDSLMYNGSSQTVGNVTYIIFITPYDM